VENIKYGVIPYSPVGLDITLSNPFSNTENLHPSLGYISFQFVGLPINCKYLKEGAKKNI
jgi:hypothetical protein